MRSGLAADPVLASAAALRCVATRAAFNSATVGIGPAALSGSTSRSATIAPKPRDGSSFRITGSATLAGAAGGASDISKRGAGVGSISAVCRAVGPTAGAGPPLGGGRLVALVTTICGRLSPGVAVSGLRTARTSAGRRSGSTGPIRWPTRVLSGRAEVFSVADSAALLPFARLFAAVSLPGRRRSSFETGAGAACRSSMSSGLGPSGSPAGIRPFDAPEISVGERLRSAGSTIA